MSSRLRLILIVLLASVALLSAGAYAYWFFLIRGPLAGDTSHDFGEVALEGSENTKVTHAFHLTNRSSDPLSIDAVRADCGCVTVRDLKLTLQGGESFDLPVTLQARPGPRTALVHIMFDDDQVQTLRVKVSGTLQSQLTTREPAVALGEDGTVEIEVTAHMYGTHDEPAPPTITTSPTALAAEFLGWQLHHRSADVALTPSMWKGRVRLSWKSDGALPAGASATLTVPPAKSLTIVVLPKGADVAPHPPQP